MTEAVRRWNDEDKGRLDVNCGSLEIQHVRTYGGRNTKLKHNQSGSIIDATNQAN